MLLNSAFNLLNPCPCNFIINMGFLVFTRTFVKPKVLHKYAPSDLTSQDVVNIPQVGNLLRTCDSFSFSFPVCRSARVKM